MSDPARLAHLPVGQGRHLALPLKAAVEMALFLEPHLLQDGLHRQPGLTQEEAGLLQPDL